MDLGIKGKTAIVTGGSRGVGRAIAHTLAEAGVDIALTYQGNKDQAETVVEGIRHLGREASAFQVDLANTDEANQLVDRVVQQFDTVDILVNNAGVWPTSYVKEMSLAEWDATLNVNLTSVFLTSQNFVNHCLEREKRGKIVNITSQAAFHGSTTGHAHYAASKSGLVGFAISLAREHAKDGINVNNLALGIVQTDMIKEALEKNQAYYVDRIPLGRVAEPKEIAEIASFLVSEKANYITGATLDVTGGMLMR
ncbi:3-oxoacyl-ACP reductase family protein [Bacillus sp. JCM 19041]|uniref:SDR family NAD(P)-dependent oxidoreductase n=1 Tax=Bacillus sp. JCM 19041 TaxID=1460637 RepID=UPI0006D2452F